MGHCLVSKRELRKAVTAEPVLVKPCLVQSRNYEVRHLKPLRSIREHSLSLGAHRSFQAAKHYVTFKDFNPT